MPKTMYKKILDTNLYDWLCEMQTKMDEANLCIMEFLPEGECLCGAAYMDCKECLRQWLNKEVD